MTIWHAADGDRRLGPFDEAELLREVRLGRLSARTKVWREGMEDWAPLRKSFPGAVVRPSFAITGSAAFAALSAALLFAVWLNYFDGLEVEDVNLAAGLFIGAGAGLAVLVPIAGTLAWRATRLTSSHEAGSFLRIVIALTALFGAALAAQMLYQGPHVVPALLAQEDFRTYRINYHPRTGVVEAVGPIGPGYARALKTKLDAGPVRRIDLTSEGGLSNEAMAAARLLQRREGLIVVARRECLSACIIVLMGGEERWADYDMILGFHALAPIINSDNAFLRVQTRRHSRESDAYMHARGVPREHLAAANKLGPSSMHMAPALDLAQDGSLTGLVGPDGERIFLSKAQALIAQDAVSWKVEAASDSQP